MKCIECGEEFQRLSGGSVTVIVEIEIVVYRCINKKCIIYNKPLSKRGRGISASSQAELIEEINNFFDKSPGYIFLSIDIKHFYKGIWITNDDNKLEKIYGVHISWLEDFKHGWPIGGELTADGEIFLRDKVIESIKKQYGVEL